MSDGYRTGPSETLTAQPSGDHTYSYTVRATDAAGNESAMSDALSVRLDTVAPQVTVVTPSDGAALQSAAQVVVTFGEDLDAGTVDGTTFKLYLGAAEVPGVVSYDALTRTATFTAAGPLGDGAYDLWLDGTSSILDAAGNRLDGGLGGDFEATFTVDTVRPTAGLTVGNVTDGEATGHTFTVTYSDNVAVDVSDLDALDVRVTGPNGYDQMATLVSVDVASDGAPRVGTYQISAPAGQWDVADNGTYTVAMATDQVSDTAGNFVLDGALGTFDVSIPAYSATPTGVDLLPASDTGVSDTDNITALDNSAPAKALSFEISGTAAGATVTLLDGDVVLGTAVAAGPTTIIVTSASGLSDGVHSITARQTESGGLRESRRSAALDVTIDTAAPSAPNAPDLDATSDSGVSSTDNITNDLTPTLNVSGVAPGDYWQIYRDGVLASAGLQTGASETLGAQPSGEHTYSYTVRATDAAGNVSGESAGLFVTIDTVGPSAPNAPDLEAASDTGASSSDNVTKDATPTVSLSGFGAYYRLERDGAQVSGNYATAYTFTEPTGLADGAYGYRLFSVDAAGNLSAASAGLTVQVDTVGPRVTSLSPAPGSTAANVAAVVARFNEDLAGATVNAATFRVAKSGVAVDGTVTYDSGLDAATFTPSAALPEGDYQVRLVGDGSIEDLAGNRLDGEYVGSFPSGNGAPGGDFVATFTNPAAGGWGEMGSSSARQGGISQNAGSSREPAMTAWNGSPVVAWEDDTGGDWEIYVKQWDGAAWTELGVGSATGRGISNTTGFSFAPSLALYGPDGSV
ncbi:MAG: hypothetical protein FJ279_28190, partial [Planctomycetes bacterium]|nr:hypothetical protein [Planctomycetota bacterium]